MSSNEKMNWSPTFRTRSRGAFQRTATVPSAQALAAHGQEQRVLTAEHVHRLVHLGADLALGDAGARDLQQPREAALADVGRLAHARELLGGLLCAEDLEGERDVDELRRRQRAAAGAPRRRRA